jgi:hypothetical protein
MRSWSRFPTTVLAMVTALAPTLLIMVALTAAMFVTEDAGVLIAGGAVAALVVFYLLRRWLLRRSRRLDPAAGRHRAATGDAPKAAVHSWPVNSPRSGVADRVQERVR